jgi:hypothetical protein
MIQVLRPESGWRKVLATIGYGWESPDFYRRWSQSGSDPVEMAGPSLDPLNPQTQYSPALLDLFRFLLESAEYVERLKRHYRMFRDSVEKENGWQGGESTRLVPVERSVVTRKRRRH